MRDQPATLQTTGPLVELRAQQTNRPLDWFEHIARGGETELDIGQPYQRGHVWGDDRRRLLIRSLMQGVPVGAITVNDRFSAGFREYGFGRASASRDWAHAIVDGKQRLVTVLMWLRSELTVPASWFPAAEVQRTENTSDGPYVRLSGLTARQGRFFRNKTIPVVETAVPSLAEEAQIFNLVNFGGVAQGETDEEVAW